MIAAMANRRVIGFKNSMPWHLPADFAWFKKNTLNKPIVMGRNTYNSIGKPLPNRRNIILTRNLNNQIVGCELFDSLSAIIESTSDAAELMIAGGAQVYQQCLPMADRLYLTFIDADYEGDTFFPDYSQYQWEIIYEKRHKANKKNVHPYTFTIMNRVK